MPDDPKTIFRAAKAKKASDALAAREAEKHKRELEQTQRQTARRRRQPPEGEVAESDAAQWVRDNMDWEEYPALWCFKYCSYSDYSGGIVEKANGKYLVDNFPELFEEGHGGHGSTWTGIAEEKRVALSEEDGQRLQDIANGLEDYPVIDEDTHSTLEFEEKQKWWGEWGIESIIDRLEEKFRDSVKVLMAISLKTNEFWSTYYREHDMDQYVEEETGINFYMGKGAVRNATEDEFVNEEELAVFKRNLFLTEAAKEFERLLREKGADLTSVANDHDLLMIWLWAEKQMGENECYDIGVFHNKRDPGDEISIKPEALEAAAEMAASAHSERDTLRRFWPEDPRQQKLAGFESRQIAASLVNQLLEDSDAVIRP